MTTSSNGSLPSALKMVGFHSAARAIIAEEQPVACLNTAISSYTFITSLDPPLSNQKDCYEFSKFTIIMKIKVWLINFCQKLSTVKSNIVLIWILLIKYTRNESLTVIISVRTYLVYLAMTGIESDSAIVWMMLLRLGCLGLSSFVLPWTPKADTPVLSIILTSFNVSSN